MDNKRVYFLQDSEKFNCVHLYKFFCALDELLDILVAIVDCVNTTIIKNQVTLQSILLIFVMQCLLEFPKQMPKEREMCHQRDALTSQDAD
mmetsp:Transcript_18228/g.20997  ORF Transcript_18228/g.20997 Transcript_18228/m.20997 type:complete len:91 (-) Transcript_18228:530-802(-)